MKKLIIAATALLIAGAAQAQSIGPLPSVSQADWDKVVAAAKTEGEVVVYTPNNGAPYFKQVTAAFMAKYGIKVSNFDARVPELNARIQAEQAAGRYLADVVQNGTQQIDFLSQSNGTYAPIGGGIPNAANLRQGLTADAVQVPCYVQPDGILVNTDMVKPADMPKSWHDLLDPKFKGHIVMEDPRAGGNGGLVFSVFLHKFGRPFLEQLAPQIAAMDRDSRQSEQEVARSQYWIYMPEVLANSTSLVGLPVKFVQPSEGSPYVEVSCGMFKNAPHPNASRLFINFFLDAEQQLTYARNGMGPTVTGVTDKLPAETRVALDAPLLGTNDPREAEEMAKLAKEIFN
jgi:iron(III) transport system substrate-binding protein